MFLTGAGISRSAGIPPYYGDGGSYSKIEREWSKAVESILTAESFMENPKKIWDNIISKMYNQVISAIPTPSHSKISEMLSLNSNNFVITQNIDGLHNKCRESNNVIELHGSIYKSQCSACGVLYSTKHVLDTQQYRCGVCTKEDNIIRPNFVLFGESINVDVYKEVMYFISENPVDYLFIIGTQSSFKYIQNIQQRVYNFGGRVILINPDPKLNCDFSTDTYVMESDDFFNKEIEIILKI